MIKSTLVLIFSLILIRTLFKFRGATKKQLDFTELNSEFRSFHLKLLFGFFLLIPTIIFILTYLLTQLSNIGFSLGHQAEFIIRPNMGTWLVISMIFSFAISFVILILIVNKSKKDKAQNYWRYYNLKYGGFNASGLLKYLSIFIILFATALTISQLNSYVKFTSDTIVINETSDFKERTYELSDISEVTHYQKTIAPNGKIVDKPHYGIRFVDGYIWRTNDDLRTPNINDQKIFNWLLERTNSELKRVKIDKK